MRTIIVVAGVFFFTLLVGYFTLIEKVSSSYTKARSNVEESPTRQPRLRLAQTKASKADGQIAEKIMELEFVEMTDQLARLQAENIEMENQLAALKFENAEVTAQLKRVKADHTEVSAHLAGLTSEHTQVTEQLIAFRTDATTSLHSASITHSIAQDSYRPGLIILGMHRSGTSLVAGLINRMGLSTGGPLLPPVKGDNELGYFERIDVYKQNDQLMRRQNILFSSGMYKYDNLKALQHIFSNPKQVFADGKRSLAFLNNQTNYPWLLKDPRLCVTFRTWLPLLNFVPAILFTYRHPMDVAKSFLTRDEHWPIEKSLRLWYVYNRRAVEQSNDMCRIITSNSAVMNQPHIEMDRIFEEMHQCGVPVPQKLPRETIDEFVKPSLQHGKFGSRDDLCNDTAILELPKTWKSSNPNKHRELFREVMRVFCAFDDRSAFKSGFVWDYTIQD